MTVFKYYSKRYASCNCYIIEFDPKMVRFDVNIGIQNKLEKLSKMKGTPNSNERTIAKMNGGYFIVGGTEFIGTYVDEGKVYSGQTKYYPSVIFWKTYKLLVEFDQSESRLNEYKNNAFWAIGVPWSIIVNGQYNHYYSKDILNKVFSHVDTKQPRSLMGQKSDGTIIWVVIDGRRSDSVGMDIDTCAKLLLSLDCINGFNLDGGGSSEMICYDDIRNKPSDGGERSIGTALFAYLNIEGGLIGEINASELNIRSSNSIASNMLGTIKNKEKVKIIDYNDGWYKVVYNDITGWCSAYYIDIIEKYKEPSNTPTIQTPQNSSKKISITELIKKGYHKIKL